MTGNGPRVALTRPEGLNADWEQALQELGGRAALYPLLRLEAVDSTPPATAVNADGYIFVSPSAVAFAWPALQHLSLPRAEQRLAAVGAGTAKALRARGAADILHPPGNGGSEQLLSILPAVDGQRWLLIRGQGGRDLLAGELRRRGAQIDEWIAYERQANLPAVRALLDDLETLDALLLTSSECVRTLFAHAGVSRQQQLQSKPLLVLHPRIAAAAQALGASRVALCEDSSGLEAALARLLAGHNPRLD